MKPDTLADIQRLKLQARDNLDKYRATRLYRNLVAAMIQTHLAIYLTIHGD